MKRKTAATDDIGTLDGAKQWSAREDALRALAKFTSEAGVLPPEEIDEIIEGAADLESFERRAGEKRLPFENVVKALKRDRKI